MALGRFSHDGAHLINALSMAGLSKLFPFERKLVFESVSLRFIGQQNSWQLSTR